MIKKVYEWQFLLFVLLILFSEQVFGESDTYKNFAELSAKEKEGVDYKISVLETKSSLSVIAIHGGKIEKGTTEVAILLASMGNYNYYSFEGIKTSSNSVLHITSTNFDEKRGRSIVSKSMQTISLHGMSGSNSVTNLGGLDTEYRKIIEKNLIAAGFEVKAASKELGATDTKNICNCNKSSKGVQIEMTKGLRDSFLEGPGSKELLLKYVTALNNAIKEFEGKNK
jgi:phage replication-related protein YjqB (UPF0714/DUF867 family)